MGINLAIICTNFSTHMDIRWWFIYYRCVSGMYPPVLKMLRIAVIISLSFFKDALYMDVVIRLAKKQDCPAMLDIYSYYVRETVISLEYEPPAIDEFERRFNTFTAQFPWLVCELCGEILGCAYAHRFHERAAYSWSAECTVYVKHGFQRRGIGRALYTCLLETLRLQGYKTAVGLICVPNENSEALHKSFGFQRQGVVQNAGFKAGAWRSVAWYALALSDYPDEPSPPLPIGEVKETKELQKILLVSAKLVKNT